MVANSAEFYRTLINLGRGSPALFIGDNDSDESYFLIFEDLVPERFRPIMAAHEAEEYKLLRQGVSKADAHIGAERVEIVVSDKLGLRQDYLEFLGLYYPDKLTDLKEERII